MEEVDKGCPMITMMMLCQQKWQYGNVNCLTVMTAKQKYLQLSSESLFVSYPVSTPAALPCVGIFWSQKKFGGNCVFY